MVVRYQQAMVVVVVGVPMLAVVFALYHLGTGQTSWRDLALFGIFYMAVSLGVTVGFHRMLTHNSFQANPLVRGLLLVFGWRHGGALGENISHRSSSGRAVRPAS